MREWQSLAHVKWECKYHVVIVPKYRKKVLFGRVRRDVRKIIRQLCRQKDVELIQGHAMPDHIHLVLSVPPKYSIAMVMGYLKGKSAIHIHRQLQGVKQGFTGKQLYSPISGAKVALKNLQQKTLKRKIILLNVLDLTMAPVRHYLCYYVLT